VCALGLVLVGVGHHALFGGQDDLRVVMEDHL
jgi:hypothetical protein